MVLTTHAERAAIRGLLWAGMPTRRPSLPVDDVGQLEDGQEHADDHAAYHHAQEYDQNGLDQRRQSRERSFDFLVQEVRDALQHVINLAGLFPGGDHADDHGGEDRMFAQSHRDAYTTLFRSGRRLNRLLHHHVADRLGDDLEHLQNRHTAANQRSERAGKPRQADLVGDDAEDWYLDAARIPEEPAGRRLDEIEPAIACPATAEEDQNEVALHEIADLDQIECGRRQRGIAARKDFAEYRHHLHQQEDRD